MKDVQRENVETYERLAASYRATRDPYRQPMHYCLAPLALHLKESFDRPRVLDMGSGAGHHTESMARHGFAVTAVDAAPSMLQIVRDHVREATCIQADFWEFTTHDRFECVIAASFIHLFPKTELARVMNRLASWLAPDGVIFIATVPGPSFDGGYLPKEDNHGGSKRWRVVYEERELLHRMHELGFDVVYRWYDGDTMHDGKTFLNFMIRRRRCP